ncbi:YCF48-related protein [Limnoglobus roseus]|uniref:Photosynthesis system II assembly factor Ycf48/Hcf136-like domain-containing protein n=1 Tax=Limnoglobus roseus TaxID=2598579 RepID=A0A5C1AAL6_9BACT|nr:YCF48-related protein [Limnoglobus roseus]QEL14078.1 hypothetical protein PX52LOC_00941 [Limnoglobus roseus]
MARNPAGMNYFTGPIHFVSPDQGWTLCCARLLESSDGGGTWRQCVHVGLPPGHLESLYFATPVHGWVVSLDGFVGRTDDGGRTWETVPLPENASGRGVFFVDPRVGWCVGDAGRVFRSDDGGRTWRTSDVGENATLRAVRFADPYTGFAVAMDHHSPTHDQVATTAYYLWVSGGHRQGSEVHDWLSAERVATSRGRIYRTKDGGRTWGRCLDSAGVGLWSVSVPTATAVRAGGDAFAASDDGGNTWTVSGSRTGGVDFWTPLIGCVSGYGSVWFTEDGGRVWRESQATGTAGRHVRFADDRHAWATMGNSSGTATILASSDGGRNWETRCPYIPFVPQEGGESA